MTTRPYELLARFKADGTIAGVHVRNITTFEGRDFEGDPQPLSDASDPAFTAFAGVFSAAVVAERNDLASQVATLQTEKNDLTTQVATLTSEKDELATQVVELSSEKDGLVTQVATLQAEKGDLASQVAALQAEIDALKNPPIPQQVTPAQIRIWLVSQGISLEQTEQFIAAIPDPMEREIARIKWEYGVTVLRTDPLVSQFAAAIGLTSEQTDAAFEAASKL